MTDTNIGPTALLGGYLRQIGPDQAVKLARELCGQLEGDPDSFHGGVWPGNVDLDLEGKAVLGKPNQTPAAQRPADQVEYTAPEFFWNGAGSAAADVYAVGLMLYAGCNGGFLPFQPHEEELTNKVRADALRRRMKGQPVIAPEGVSDELKKVIEKALAYDPERRYITAAELLTALGRTDEALPAAAVMTGGEAAAESGAVPEAEEVPAEDAPAADKEPAEETPDAPAGEAETIHAEEQSAPAEEAPAPAAEPKPESVPQAADPEENKTADGFTCDSDAPAAEVVMAAAAAAAGSRSAGPARHAAKGKAASRSKSPAGDKNAAGAHEAASKTEHAGASRQVQVQKDFESAPRSREQAAASMPAAQRKRRSRAVVPAAAVVLALALIGGAGYHFLFARGGSPEISLPFRPAATDEAEPSALPATNEPSPTAKPTASPRPTATARPTATPAPSGEPSPSPGPSNNTLPGGVNSGAGTNTDTSMNAGAGTGTNTGSAGSGYGAGTGTGSGYGSGYGTGYGSATGSGSGSGTPSAPSTPSYQVQPAEGTVYLTGELVRVRSGPGTGYGILGLTHKGDSLSRTGTVSTGWTQVKYNSATGYVFSQYLSDTDPTASPAPSDTPAPSVTATPTPSDTPAPSPSATPAPAYTVVAEAKTYEEAKAAAGTAGLAPVTGETDLAALTAALDQTALEYVWIDAEKSAEDNVWRSGGVELTGPWAEGEPKAENGLLLLHKTEAGWVFVTAAAVDPADPAYAGKLGYAVAAAASEG